MFFCLIVHLISYIVYGRALAHAAQEIAVLRWSARYGVAAAVRVRRRPGGGDEHAGTEERQARERFLNLQLFYSFRLFRPL
jgi:hypothetical protein